MFRLVESAVSRLHGERPPDSKLSPDDDPGSGFATLLDSVPAGLAVHEWAALAEELLKVLKAT